MHDTLLTLLFTSAPWPIDKIAELKHYTFKNYKKYKKQQMLANNNNCMDLPGLGYEQ